MENTTSLQNAILRHLQIRSWEFHNCLAITAINNMPHELLSKNSANVSSSSPLQHTLNLPQWLVHMHKISKLLKSSFSSIPD